MSRIYLDSAATTPLDREVAKAMRPYFSEKFGNPGAIHGFGQEALRIIDGSRQKIIELLAGDVLEDFRNVIFTGSATEANNFALRGAVKAFYRLKRNEKYLPARIIVSSIEHDSVFQTAEDLEEEGVEIVYLPVDKKGLIDIDELKSYLNEQTVLVSVHYVNNETGVVEKISEIGDIVGEFRSRLGKDEIFPLFHTDAVQAFQYFDCSPKNLNADLVTLSAHKMFGPKGTGVLYFDRRLSKRDRQAGTIIGLLPIITGGGQEFGMRSGTENVPGIAGFAKAAEIAAKNRTKETKRITDLRDYFVFGLRAVDPKIVINTPFKISAPHILNVRFPGIKAEELIGRLDMEGVAVSAGSACSSRNLFPSRVLLQTGLSEEEALQCVRFSFSRETRKSELISVLKILKKIFLEA